MKSTNLLLGILGGVAVGAIAGILFAPDKGTKTRKRILEKGNGYTNDLKNKFDDLYNSVANKYEAVVEQNKEFSTDHQQK